ncbi:arylesterase [Sandarakinorhabdus cyanobacteriorum]|uniref:Arylesterase n=1 Tax=Sandarakinorhabdus cyanobacteriorum TaxID=1981098 RepID=A0A255YWL9_9SPHN|nr:arylesterase [Sandarakinorhabdus cyanobacteriorum]OYQ33055.1 arylesterase [Sandarakinorhabdus cyanobacteriorum]
MAAMIIAAFVSQAAVAKPLVVLAFGDSLTAGYQLPPGQGFAPQLEKALKAKGRDVTVVGAGVSGDTSTQGRARIGWVLAGMKQKPDLVVLELGANDMLRGQPPRVAKQNLDAMVKAFKAKGARVLVAGMRANPTLGKAYVTEFEALFPAVAKANGVALYPFFLDGVAAQKGLQLADGMHPNAKGVAVMVNRILPAVERELAQIK